MEPNLQRTTTGRVLTRAIIGGLLAVMFTFVYRDWWVIPVSFAVGAVLAVVVPTVAHRFGWGAYD